MSQVADPQRVYLEMSERTMIALMRMPTSEPVAHLSQRMRLLEKLACPTLDDVAFFNEHIEMAKAKNLSYREALEFIVRLRNGGAD